MQESTITVKGQTTLPKKVREALDLSPGDRVRYVIAGGEVRIAKSRKASTLSGILRQDKPAVSLEEMDEAVARGAVARASKDNG